MAATAEPQVATPETRPPQTLAEAVSGFDERLKAGDLSPYRKAKCEQSDTVRFKRFRELSRVRGVRYAGCTLENFATPTAKHVAARDAVLDYCDLMRIRCEEGGGLVLLGPPGTGKDHLLMGAMRTAILDYGFSVEWHDGLRMFHRIKAAIATNDTERFIRGLVEPQILALSDPVPPRDELSAYELAVLRDVIESRYSKGLVTWVTTNVTNTEDAHRLMSVAVTDRLMHNATQVACNWKSYRRAE